jgi:hypothetical protein
VATFRPSTKLLFVERDKECEVTDKETTVIQAAGTWSFVFHSFSMCIDLLNIEQVWQYTYNVTMTRVAIVAGEKQRVLNFMRVRITRTNKMHSFLLIYFNNKPLHVSSSLAAHHQEDQFCINSNCYRHALCWLAAGSQSTGCSKHVEAYYWNKLKVNSASCWFI